MIQVIRADQRHSSDFGWLLARWHFSFGDYRDPANMNWGVLRVFNDDIVRAGGGFETHPHRDMEIVTVVLEGALEHQDSLGSRGLIRPGEVQVMSAGTGISHSERNASKTEDLHLMQIWIIPRHRGNKPRWEQRTFDPGAQRGKLLPVVSGGNVPGTLSIDQDAVFHLATLGGGDQISHSTDPARKLYLFLISGSIRLNEVRTDANHELFPADQARISGLSSLSIHARQESRLILLDLADIPQ